MEVNEYIGRKYLQCLKPAQGVNIWKTERVPENRQEKARQPENSKKSRETIEQAVQRRANLDGLDG